MSVQAYIGTAFPDSARFGAIPRRRGIHTPAPPRRVRQENRLAAWRTRWLHAPHRQIAEFRSYLLYIPCAGVEQYHARLFGLSEWFGGDVNSRPHIQLVAFPARSTGGTAWPTASGGVLIPPRRADCCGAAQMPTSTCGLRRNYSRSPVRPMSVIPRSPDGWRDLEAPQYLCVPTPSALAYVPAH